MKMQFAKITIVIMVLVSILCSCYPINVDAGTYALYNIVNTQYDGGVCTVQYYAPLDYINVLVIQKSSTSYYIVFYDKQTTVKGASSGSSDKYTFTGGTALYATTTSLEKAKTTLFEGETLDLTETTSLTSMSTLYIYSESTKPGSTIRMEKAESLESVYYNYYYEKNGEYPTFIEDSGDNGNESEPEEEPEGWWEELINGFKEMKDILADLYAIITFQNTPFQNSYISNEITLHLMNELEENEFYVSILRIKNTLSDLYNEDYSDPNGFYELGLLDMSKLGTRHKRHPGYGAFVAEEWSIDGGKNSKEITVDFGTDENTKVLNFDWYFGTTTDDPQGYEYLGIKPYIDGIISAFLWLLFAWALYKNMPNWISGELTQISNLASTPFKSNDYNTSYEAYKERMDRNTEYKERYKKEKKEEGGK